MGVSRAEIAIGVRFPSDRAVARKSGEVREAEQTNWAYEAVLLLVSFVLLLFGLLPARPDRSPSIATASAPSNPVLGTNPGMQDALPDSLEVPAQPNLPELQP